jgi:chemotaxis protein MotB
MAVHVLKKGEQKPPHDDHVEHEEHSSLDEHGGDEPWLVSYADLMTLLFGFFAMLFTYASFEDEEVIKMHKSVAKYFGGTYVAPEQELAKAIKFEWGRTPYANDMDLKVIDDGIELSFITSVLFSTGSAELLPAGQKPLEVLIELIRSTGKEFQIHVEGHTDDQPIGGSAGKYPTNWELSAARAATIVRMFEAKGFPSDLLAATGFGSSRPAFPNKDSGGSALPENQAHNRRVVIKVIVPKAAPSRSAADVKPAAPPANAPPAH